MDELFNNVMKILVEKEEFREYPEEVKLLLAIALHEVTPYSWGKIAEILGFNLIILKEKLKTLAIPFYEYDEKEMLHEAEASRSL